MAGFSFQATETSALPPTDDFNGLASFTYVANTPEGARTEAVVYIDVNPVNDAPVAVNDRGFSVDEGGVFSIEASDLTGNDKDIDGDELTITSVSGNGDVTVELTDDGVIIVRPTPFFFGETSFEYTVSDPGNLTSTATVKLEVDPVNDPPEPINDAYTISEDEELLRSKERLTENDVERDGDDLTIVSVRRGTGGSVQLLPNESVLFNPTDNFTGLAHYFYTVSDGHGGFAEARVDIQVNPVNDRPTIRDDGPFREDENVPITLEASTLLANDFDVDGIMLKIVTVSNAENGVVELLADGKIRFTPDAGYRGEASFTYTAEDEGGLSDHATVTLEFVAVMDAPPVAVDDHVDVYEDVETTIIKSLILDNDTDVDPEDVLEIKSAGVPAGFSGSVRINDEGHLVFTPKADSTSNTQIKYTVTDNADGEDEGTIFINIIPVNDAPVANPDVASTSLDVPLVLRISDLLGNDEDVDDDIEKGEVTFVRVADTSDGGVASIYNDKFIVVDYAEGFSGQTTLNYVIEDRSDAESIGTVNILVSDTRVDSLMGTETSDLLIGTSRGDAILGLAGRDDLFGRGGNDVLIGGDGADRLDGGEGFDLVEFGDSTAGVRVDLQTGVGQGGHAQGDLYISIEDLVGTAYADELFGNVQGNVLYGERGNDLLYGRGGDDRLDGGTGDDHLIGGAGADHLRGAFGSDTADYSDLTSGDASAGPVNISLEDGTASGGDAEGDTFDSIENLIGTKFDDVLVGDDNANVITGGRGDDTIRGGAGDDILEGGRGADVIEGGEGIDRAVYSLSAEGVSINLENAAAGGGDAEGDTFSSIELIVGSFHDDTIVGDANDNTFMGGRGADLINGGLGFDTADYSDADEAIVLDLASGFGSAGEADGDRLISIERILASLHDDIISGGDVGEHFVGGLGNDFLSGNGGSDSYHFGFGDGEDAIMENGSTADVDRLVLGGRVFPVDVSVLQEGDDLVLEFENQGGALTDKVRVIDHFLGRESGLEEIVFGNGAIWDRDRIQDVIQAASFNAQDDVVRLVDEDVPHVIAKDLLLFNDSAERLESLNIVRVDNFAGGTAEVLDDGSVRFRGAQDFYGDAFFDYIVADEFGRESRATVEVQVLPINDSPVAFDDGVYIGLEDTVLELSLAHVLGNDVDVDGDELRIIDFSPLLDLNDEPFEPSFIGSGSNGNARLIGDMVRFTPSHDFFGFAGFSYTISDGKGETSTAEVKLHILAVNDGPRSGRDTETVRLGRSEFIAISDLMGNDTDPEGDKITFTGIDSPTNGSIALVDAALQIVTDPIDAVFVKFDAVALGNASFRYTTEDALGATGGNVVEIRVRPLNDPPVAHRDVGFETTEDQFIPIDPDDLLANDTDANKDPLFILELDRFPINGTVEFNDEGLIIFTPRADYNGKAGFYYTVTDGKDLETEFPGTDRAFVEITIVPANDGPRLRDDVVSGKEDLPITVIRGRGLWQ